MPTTAERSVLVAVFERDSRALVAVRLLREVGLAPHQIGHIFRHGEVLEAGGALVAVDVPEHDLTGGLIGMGVPVGHARELGLQLERGRAIVTAQPERGPHLARRVLERAGALSLLTCVPRLHLPAGLSPREVEVLRLVVDGRTNREIAHHLVLSERTVPVHVRNILTKTNSTNRAAAAAFALRHGLA
jgi:DNA-binding CsgD family transcriptional regulator